MVMVILASETVISALAHDVFVPCWRGQAATSFQEWRFATAATPADPEAVANSFGFPKAAIAPNFDGGAEGWKYQFSGTGFGTAQSNYWDMGPGGTITLTIPNRTESAAGSFKYIWLQITEFYDNSTYFYSTPSFTSPSGATQIGATTRQVVESVLNSGDWYVSQSVWRVAPNPDGETIVITAPADGAVIDQVVVDTRCVDGFSPAGTPSVGTQTECDNQGMMLYGGGSYTWDLANAAGVAGTGWDLLNVTGTGTIDVQSTSGNPFTIVVNSPAGGAANFDALSDQDWTIATTGEGIQNFAADKFVVDTTGFHSALGNGIFSVQTVNSGADLVLHFQKATTVPVNNVAYTRAKDLGWEIRIADLLTNAAPAGHNFSLLSVADASHGSASISGDWVFYLPTQPDQNLTDTFTYLVRDNDISAENSGTVTLNETAQQPAQKALISVSGGGATVVFAGVPGYTYDVERSADADFTTSTTIWTTNIPAGGVFSYVDDPAPLTEAYYRLKPH